MARPKPAPDVCSRAAERLGVRPERCLVVEDSVSGVTGFVGASHIPDGHADRLRTLGVLEIVLRIKELPVAVAAARINL